MFTVAGQRRGVGRRAVQAAETRQQTRATCTCQTSQELPFDLILNEKHHQLELRLAISQGGRGRRVRNEEGKVGAFSMQLNILQPLDLPPTLVLVVVLYGSVGLRGRRDTTAAAAAAPEFMHMTLVIDIISWSGAH